MTNIEQNKALLAKQILAVDAALQGVSFPDQAGQDLQRTMRELMGMMAGRLLQTAHPDPVFPEGYLPAPVTNFRRTANWLSKCGKVPGTRDASVQFGVHLEESAEVLDEVTIISMTGVDAVILNEASKLLKHVGHSLKNRLAHIVVHDRGEFLDGLSDCEVTGNGVAFLMGMDKENHDIQVLDKNDDKFDADGNPVILPGGKIGRRAGWTPPDNELFAGAMPADPPLSIGPLRKGASLEEATEWAGEHFVSHDPELLQGVLAQVILRSREDDDEAGAAGESAT